MVVFCVHTWWKKPESTGVLSGNTDLEKATKTLPYVDTLDETGSQRWQERVSQARSLVLQIATCIHVILYGLGAKLRYMGYFASLLHTPPPREEKKLIALLIQAYVFGAWKPMFYKVTCGHFSVNGL